MQHTTTHFSLPLNQLDGINQQFDTIRFSNVAPNPLSANNNIDFSKVITNVVKDIDQQGQAASAKATAVDLGKSDDLVGAMVATQTASLSFSAMVQVRNKLLSAYDDVMRMPV